MIAEIDAQESVTPRERVRGPVRGFFFATYAAPWRRGGFIAHTKICPERPTDVWDCVSVGKVAGFGCTASAAMAASERRAHQALCRRGGIRMPLTLRKSTRSASLRRIGVVGLALAAAAVLVMKGARLP